MIISHEFQGMQPITTHKGDSAEPTLRDRVAVLLAGYGEVQSYRALSVYNQAATKYIASQFVPIPEWLYPLAGWFLALQDLYNFGVKHDHFMSPENEIFEKQRLGIEEQLQHQWGNRVQVFKGDRVQAQLQHQYPLVSIGWVNHDTPFINWSQPNLKQAAKSLITAGAQTILFKPLGWVTDNYETILDVEDAIQYLQRQYPTVTYTRLGCVNDDPDFLKIAAEWANPHIEAMLSVPQHHKHIQTRRLDLDMNFEVG